MLGFVAIGPNRRRVLHGGVVMRDEAHVYRNGPVLVVIEDRAAVPTPDQKALLWASPASGASTTREEDALLTLVLDGCERGDLDFATHEEYLATARRKIGERLAARGERGQGASGDGDAMRALQRRLGALPERVKAATLARAKAVILMRSRCISTCASVPPRCRDGVAPSSRSAAACSGRPCSSRATRSACRSTPFLSRSWST